jgi:hypothetical protein
MPKKRTAKDQARYYTAHQRTRLESSNLPPEPSKDVTTQLRELRIEQARDRLLSKPTVSTDTIQPLGFPPVDYAVPSNGMHIFNDLNTVPSGSRPARRIPGPPPPKSWIAPKLPGLRPASIPSTLRSRIDTAPSFPDLERPNPRSLVHHSLLALGTYFSEHQQVSKYYLPLLGLQVKQWLLTYIAAKNVGGAISYDGLNVLFPHAMAKDDPEEMKDIVTLSRKDEVHLRHLDLADSLGSTLTISQLRSFLSPADIQPMDNKFTILHTPIEIWNIDAPRFPNLTHLSLDISPAQSSKFDRLKLAHILSQNCTRLTHLSLAGVFNSAYNSASALVYLSRNLVCLEYVDLSRTSTLLEFYGPPVYGWNESEQAQWKQVPTVADSLNWDGAWRNVRTLVIEQCGFNPDSARGLRDNITSKRGLGGWVRIIIN